MNAGGEEQHLAAQLSASAAARRVLGVAGVLLTIGIVIGALGAHALRAVLDARQLVSLDTAVDYQLFNALGMLVVGVLMRSGESPRLGRIAAMLMAGIVCFSGGIYVMLAGASRLLGFITPVGGVLLILAWAAFAWEMLRHRAPDAR
ncbi:MAG: DUF423 domain-containing protein [Nevskiaceae bacterium]|nr:DUF423 domain-containing protein [Nevskiaceae bacterium]